VVLIKVNLLIKGLLEMKLKKGVNIKQLNPFLKDKLDELDNIYRKYDAELWITSGNDSIHWGSTKKPKNWRELSEEEVRKISNSKHYLNSAIDVRIWNIPKKDFEEWLQDVYKLFPSQMYDVVKEKNHVHIEFDPKIELHEQPPLHIPEPPEVVLKEEKPIKLPKLRLKMKWYKRNGVKRITGGILLIAGGILSLNPPTAAIGQGLIILGGGVGAVGLGHAAVKARKSPKRTWVDIVLEILSLILNKTKAQKK